MAFALSGFMAGYAGVCLAFATERFSTSTFDPSVSILVVSMVVIGGLGSVPGAVLGAVYLVGLPAIFGTTSTIQFLTSGLGLIAFILYLPGGLAGSCTAWATWSPTACSGCSNGPPPARALRSLGRTGRPGRPHCRGPWPDARPRQRRRTGTASRSTTWW